MKSLGKYISKYLMSFMVFIMVLLLINILSFVWTFHSVMTAEYGPNSPQNMLKKAAGAAGAKGIRDDIKMQLRKDRIWAIFLSQDGDLLWSADAPEDIPQKYTIQDVAVFSKGYLKDYPVFVWNTDDGLLVLGYPKDSYTKLTSNYYSIRAVKMIPVFFTGMLVFDLLLLFLAYFMSRHKILKTTEPLISSVQALSDGKPVSLSIHGELSEVADSVNKAARILSRQNEARANWIGGVSHDIRTPLSIIMGYGGRISDNSSTSASVREQAQMIQKQSIKIKELVEDLNLVSKLEYEMQPLRKETIRLSKLLRSYAAELLNAGIPEIYPVHVVITGAAEAATLDCDARLISRAVNNLVLNSMNHNPQGCKIELKLDAAPSAVSLAVTDDGVGLSPEKLKEIKETPHYMESTDERLNLRHGLGLVLVRQIARSHGGRLEIHSEAQKGYEAVLIFSIHE